jgi:XTP/dITP diphosphohydrolase
MNSILIATHNPAKINEYKKILREFGIKIITLKTLNINREPKEKGKNFLDISFNKAKYYARLTKRIALADDGGLMIRALDNWPGIKSRRLNSQKPHADLELIHFVLDRMKNKKDRTALLGQAITIYNPKSNQYLQTQAYIRGNLAKTLRVPVLPGFPYRSILYIPKARKLYCHFNHQDHRRFNHRREALNKIKDKLLQFLKQ